MLIAPHIHCFGLLLAAMLISAVHAMPMDRHKRSSPPSEVMGSFDSDGLIFGYTNSMFPSSPLNSIHSSPPGSPANSIHSSNTHPPGSPSNSIHSSDALPPASSKKLKWDSIYRATVLAHTEAVLDLTAPDHTMFDINTDMEFGTEDRKQITLGIQDAMGKANFPRYAILYMNWFTETVTKLTKTTGLCVFVLESLDTLCKDRPCVGWRMRSGDNGKLLYVSVYQLDEEGKPGPDPRRYATTETEPSPEDWAAYDQQFWARFPSERFADPEWGVLKERIDRQHIREMNTENRRRRGTPAGRRKMKEKQGHKSRKGAMKDRLAEMRAAKAEKAKARKAAGLHAS